MNPIHQSFQKIENHNHFRNWKRAITPLVICGFYPKTELDLYLMIIYLCIKYESNKLIISKDIERKPFFEAEKGP